MEKAAVTIFIPTYQRPGSLPKSIESALRQTYKNLRIIISDNASQDETPDIVRQFAKKDSRITYIRHPENRGMFGNYAYCLSIVQTEYFSFLSDDDILLPSFCQTAVAGFTQFPDIVFFACSTTILDKEKGVLRTPLELWPREGRFAAPEGALQMVGKYPVPLTVLFRTQLASAATIDFQNAIAWDCDYLLQLAARFPIAISKKTAGVFFCHPHSFSGNQPFSATLQSIERIKERIANFDWMEISTRNAIQERLNDDFRNIGFRLAFSHIAQKRFKEAKQGARNLLAHHPFKIKNLFFWLTIHAIVLISPLRFVFFALLKIRRFHRRRRLASLRQRLCSPFFLFLFVLFFNFMHAVEMNWNPYNGSENPPPPVQPKIVPGSFLILNNPSDSGMFAVFYSVLGALTVYENGHYAGIKIDLNSGRYLDLEKGPNWWEYFFEPIHLGNEDAPCHVFSYEEYMHLVLTDFPKDRHAAHAVIQRYIRLKPHIQEELDGFVKDHFTGHYMIGVHYRGTDKKVEVSLVSYEIFYHELLKIIDGLCSEERENFRIYVATDEQAFLDFIKARFPSRLIANHFVRSTNGRALHSYNTGFFANNYQLGKESLLDALFLSKCNILLRPASSGFSWSACCFNPNMKVIHLH